MKKILAYLICFILMIHTNSFAIKENRIIRVGYVNYAKLIEKLDKDNKIQKQIDKITEDYDNKINSLKEDIEKLQTVVGSNSNDSNIQENIAKLEQANLDLVLLQIKSTQEIQKISDQLRIDINEKITQIIQNIAKRQNFDIIIDSSLVLISAPALDITNFVLASL